MFLSVGWVSGKYPSRLYKALLNSSTVLTAWNGNQLVGLVRLLDDSEMLAYMHYVLAHPDYQGQDIAGTLVEMIKLYNQHTTSFTPREITQSEAHT